MTLSTTKVSRSKTSVQSIRLYRTIADLPMWNWEQIKKTSDLRYLIRLDDYDELPEIDVSGDLWDSLQDEFSEKCGMTESGGYHFDKFIELQKLKRDEIIYSCDEHNSKLSKTKIKIKLLEGEIEEIPVSQQTLYDQVVRLEIFFTRDLDPKTTSVLKWHIYLNEYEKRINELAKSPKGTT